MITRSDYELEEMSAVTRQASDKGIQTFIESEYGLSAHWGLYSLLQGDEWIYFRERIPLTRYEKLMDEFNPSRFNAKEWADLMLEAGQKFLLITSKHHDGFCLWDSELTDFKVTNTRFGRDILQELASALYERGIGLHFYYSLVDWTRPSYRECWSDYVSYYQGQIRELCSNFGKIGGFIFDGYWPRQEFEGDEIKYFAAQGAWDLAGTYNLIHELQPDAVIANNSHVLPMAGEDYQVWELDLPGENTIGFNCTQIGDKPTACWWNLNAGWSYQPWRHLVKTAKEIVETFQAVRDKGAVFILNTGPRPFGDIHPEEQAVLRKIGQQIRERDL